MQIPLMRTDSYWKLAGIYKLLHAVNLQIIMCSTGALTLLTIRDRL